MIFSFDYNLIGRSSILHSDWKACKIALLMTNIFHKNMHLEDISAWVHICIIIIKETDADGAHSCVHSSLPALGVPHCETPGRASAHL